MVESILQCLNLMNDANIDHSSTELYNQAVGFQYAIGMLNGHNQAIANDLAPTEFDSLKNASDSYGNYLSSEVRLIPEENALDRLVKEREVFINKNDFCDSSKDLLERKGYTYSDRSIRHYAYKDFKLAKYMECFSKHKQLLHNREHLHNIMYNQN